MTRRVDVYRIGWWTHRWWPTRALVEGLLTGKQLSPRADTGSRHVGRIVFLKTMVRHLRLVRRPHRPWQAEVEGLQFARRAFTAAGAKRKIQYDRDLASGWVTGHSIDSPWQLRRTARANARAIRMARKP